MPSIAAGCGAIVLAAGASTRMGAPKQLLAFRGHPLVVHAALTALHAGCDPVVVVVGAQDGALRTALAGLPVEVTSNPRWHEGIGSSIHAGLSALGDRTDEAILTLVDQPFVTAAVIEGLAAAYRRSGRSIVASRYAGTVGVPALFARAAWPWLLALPPDQGCKGVILGHPDDARLIDCPEAEADLDTPDDYRRAMARG